VLGQEDIALDRALNIEEVLTELPQFSNGIGAVSTTSDARGATTLEEIVLGAAAELAYYLVRSNQALKLQPVDGVRGFEPLPLPPVPAVPVMPGPQPADATAPKDIGDPNHAPPATR